MDRFYTSVSLALELLAQKVYSVGTVQTRRLGFPAILKDTRKKRPKDIPHGNYAVARARAVPSLVACRWWDSRPVYVLATGASLEERTASKLSVFQTGSDLVEKLTTRIMFEKLARRK
jgi:hypothetical protein